MWPAWQSRNIFSKPSDVRSEVISLFGKLIGEFRFCFVTIAAAIIHNTVEYGNLGMPDT